MLDDLRDRILKTAGKRLGGLRGINDRIIPAIVGSLLLCAIAWGLLRSAQDVQPEIVQLTIIAAATQTNVQIPTLAANLSQTPPQAALTGAAPTLMLSGRQEVRQFAASAVATSQISDLDWGAVQAAGPPNTEACGDARTAWATAEPNAQASITLYYPQLVYPTRVLVYQSMNPGLIIQVTVTDTFGEVHTVYQSPPQFTGTCPFTLLVDIGYMDDPANTVTIYIDQASSTVGRIEIDAVELIGVRY